MDGRQPETARAPEREGALSGQPRSETFRIAAVADLHVSESAQDTVAAVVRCAAAADVLLLCGDLTDHGFPQEARVLARGLAASRVPVLATLGNHDFEHESEAEIAAILTETGVHVLDGTVHEVGPVGFAGTKGFGGGFGPRSLAPWGERIIKQFVQTTLEEALKLEVALTRLDTPIRIVLLHYAPIAATVDGEPLEIHPFLGSTRLEEPLDRYEVTAVFHGHAHHGAPEGRTKGGIPVYNVSAPLLRACQPDGAPVKIVEIPLPPERP